MLLLPSLDEKPLGVEGLRIYTLLHELLHVIHKHRRQQSGELAETLAAAVLRLSADSQQVLGMMDAFISKLLMKASDVQHICGSSDTTDVGGPNRQKLTMTN